MFDNLKKYGSSGHFFFKRGGSLAAAIKKLPSGQGVYLIMRLSHGRVELVYIGKSSEMFQDGSFEHQSLKERIKRSQAFFESKFDDEDIDALDVYWYVTMDKSHNDLPAYVEAVSL